MKIVRVKTEEGISYGNAESEGVRLWEGSPLVAWDETEVVVPYGNLQLLAPVFPTKIVGVGRNYEEHISELDNPMPTEPIIFLKPPTSVIGPEQPIIVPPDVGEIHHEAELAVVIGAIARHTKAEDVEQVLLGYTVANDITAHDLQQQDGQWGRAKGFDTFCPLGPAIETELDPLESLLVECRVNDEVRQAGRTSEMIFGVAELIEYVSEVMTLLPGDVILTGTPPGVGPIEPGDRVEAEIEGIGVLGNPVASP
ncbi:MAG: fumarylacetoacetate hydrolase family protein [Acidimicrobiia bacterium]